MNKIILPILILFGFSSCNNYYQAITTPEPTKPDSYKNFRDSSKYYVLRNGSESFAMKNISVSSDGRNVHCTLAELPFEHKLHANSGANSKMKYQTKNFTDNDETGVINEVHIYLLPGNKTSTGSYTLALENIQKAETLEKNKIKTRNSYALGTGIGIGAAVIGAVGIGAIIFTANFSIF